MKEAERAVVVRGRGLSTVLRSLRATRTMRNEPSRVEARKTSPELRFRLHPFGATAMVERRKRPSQLWSPMVPTRRPNTDLD